MNGQTESHMAPSAGKFELDGKNMRIAYDVTLILQATNEDGSPRYDNLEVRDFMMACMFELGLPMSYELQMVMNRFLEDIECDAKEPTADDVIASVRKYFEENPLNEELAKTFQKLGSKEMQKGREDFKNDGAHRNATLAAAGLSANKRAPRANFGGAKKGLGQRPRKGLS
jgi:hypothetical protein